MGRGGFRRGGGVDEDRGGVGGAGGDRRQPRREHDADCPGESGRTLPSAPRRTPSAPGYARKVSPNLDGALVPANTTPRPRIEPSGRRPSPDPSTRFAPSTRPSPSTRVFPAPHTTTPPNHPPRPGDRPPLDTLHFSGLDPRTTPPDLRDCILRAGREARDYGICGLSLTSPGGGGGGAVVQMSSVAAAGIAEQALEGTRLLGSVIRVSWSGVGLREGSGEGRRGRSRSRSRSRSPRREDATFAELQDNRGRGTQSGSSSGPQRSTSRESYLSFRSPCRRTLSSMLNHPLSCQPRRPSLSPKPQLRTPATPFTYRTYVPSIIYPLAPELTRLSLKTASVPATT